MFYSYNGLYHKISFICIVFYKNFVNHADFFDISRYNWLKGGVLYMIYKLRSLTNCPASSQACSSHSFMKKAVIYARYSSDSQSEQSIDGQLRVCREYAERENIKIVDTYIDRAMTGTNDHRPDFQRMLRDSKKKGFEYLLVYKFDRFARSRHDSAVNKAILNRNGVKVISATEQISDTPEGIILEGMLESFAEYYSAELSQKVKRGRKESRIKGLYVGGRVPFGYSVENKIVKINEKQADIVRQVYNDYP